MSIIGRVSVSEGNPSTCDEFTFWLDSKQKIKPFDIIKVQHIDGSSTFGIVQEMFYVTDSSGHLTNYISSDFGDVNAEPATLRLGMTYAKAKVIGNSKNIDMPVLSGQVVSFADDDEIRDALGLGNLENEIPAGFIQMSNGRTIPIGYERDFLLGPDGAHVNISGISGLATKTSYAMFLLQAIQQKCNDVAIVIINVKGKDLLQLDEKNPMLKSNNIEDWKKCRLHCEPFKNVKYYYPFTSTGSKHFSLTSCRADSLKRQHDHEQAFNFVYDYGEHKQKINLLFSNIDDPNMTWDSIVTKFLNEKDLQSIGTWTEFLKEAKERQDKESSKKDEISVLSWRKFYRLINTVIGPYIDKSIFQRSKSPEKKYKHVYLSEEINKIRPGDVYVIDIESMLHQQHQYLVIGDVFESIRDLVQGGNASGVKKIIVFFDELNKYAPSNAPKDSPILLDILDVAERGRSSGVVLFSAQQFKSAVFDRVHGNCSTHVYGRTNSIELSKPGYKFIPNTYKNIITRLDQGELVVEHPTFRTLLKIKFPYPSYDQAKGA